MMHLRRTNCTKKNFWGGIVRCSRGFCSGLFPVFTKINFDSVENTVAFIKSRTNLEVSDFAIQLEYFGSMKYQLDEVTSVFFHGNEDPIRRLLLILVLMSPLLILYLLVWKDVFSDLKQKKSKIDTDTIFIRGSGKSLFYTDVCDTC